MKAVIFYGSVLGVGLLLAGCVMPMRGSGPGMRVARTYQSNGEQIYFTATSQRGTPITFEMGGGGGMMGRAQRAPGMMGGMMACVTCHGPEGRGGQVRMMMMTTFVAPDIRYTTLTAAEMKQGGEEHPAYTDETIKRAITQGVDPAGKPLVWPMPRWSISEADLNDLLAFLKTWQ